MTDLRRAIVAWRAWRTPGAVLRAIRDRADVDEVWEQMPSSSKDEVRAMTEQLDHAGAWALMVNDADYPTVLAARRSPPPVIFGLGNRELLQRRGVGVCGSRTVSSDGLEAARALASAVTSMGDVLVAGNAQGVDAEAQGTALSAGGSVIAVLPEGILHFRLRSGEADVEPTTDRLLVLSQFPPWQPWSVGGAMTRNELIVGLAAALVVVEAGDRGGSLAAGEAGLKAGVPVIALEFGRRTPPGNALLLRRGAISARSPREVYAHIETAGRPVEAPEDVAQLPLAF